MIIDKYFTALKSPKDWEVLYFTGPYANTAASMATRVCVRNGNNVICVNRNNTITYLNPSAQEAFPISIQKAGNEYQFMLPQGTTIETYPSGSAETAWFAVRVTVQPNDLPGLTGVGVTTPINGISDNKKRVQYVADQIISDTISGYLNATNNTEGIRFSNRTGDSFPLSTCVVASTSKVVTPFIHRIIVEAHTTHTREVEDYVTETNTAIFSSAIEVTKTNTKSFTATASTTILKTATSTNFQTARATSTSTSRVSSTSTIVKEATLTVGKNTTIASEAFATSIRVVSSDVDRTNTVRNTVVHQQTLTNVLKSTLVNTNTVRTTSGKLKKSL
jgi:hypothetical protein